MNQLSDNRQSITYRARTALDALRKELLDQRTDQGFWNGELSPSSLSTATAISAISANLLHANETQSISSQTPQQSVSHGNAEDSLTPSYRIDHEHLARAITQGLLALECQQNTDGGFGDTDRSHSNIATSYLVLAASTLVRKAIGQSLPEQQILSLTRYIEKTGSFEALKRRYGKDKTFVVPILTNLAIAGIVPWKDVPALPFEAAAFPQSMYRMLRMPVVSYAIPALVAIGQARHFHGPKTFQPLRLLRSAMIGRTLKVLETMQPQSGGYLEATPLTAFVVMSLAATGRSRHQVSRNGLRFLLDSMSPEGLWPIDTNLATWVTSLSIHALACDPKDDGDWCSESLLQWHLNCQHLKRHPFTGAEPGGWGWSDLSGAVPDSDDTPAAMIALREASRWRPESGNAIKQSIEKGVNWLSRLQNRNGGWPTFCRGWGKLPFDRSSNDLTAHTLRAIGAASELGIEGISSKQLHKAKSFLIRNQQADGSWLPLWFGNQDREDESNPIYGTSKVLVAAVHCLDSETIDRGINYLRSQQNRDGGWGGGPSMTKWLEKSGYGIESREADSNGQHVLITSSIEETALAVDALITAAKHKPACRFNPQVPSSNGVQGGHASTPYAPPIVPNTGGNGVKVSAETTEIGAMRTITGESEGLIGSDAGKDALGESIIRGIEFLIDGLEKNRHRISWPIGFYFAKLWYHEKLYPPIFTAVALGKFLRLAADNEKSNDSEKLKTGWPQ